MNKLSKSPTIVKVHPKYSHCVEKVFSCGQEHIFRWWDELSDTQRKKLIRQISSIDFSLLQELIDSFCNPLPLVQSSSIEPKCFGSGYKPEPACASFRGSIEPPDIIPIPRNDAQLTAASEAKAIGEEALRKGKVAILTVAGGQGTRLGVDSPKGAIAIGPVTGKTLFQLHGEKILAIIKRYKTELPWYVMTSEANHKQTKKFFEDKHFFNLKLSDVILFTQGMLPVVDLNGRLIMDAKDHIATSPNGHGGTVLALKKEKVLTDMKKRGIEYIFYFQVDNALINIADPAFIGYHILKQAEMSSKVTAKRSPEEKVGTLVYVDGKLGVIEYSELSQEDLQERNKDGSLKYNAGNLAIHILNVEFVEKLNKDGFVLPYHKALKHVPFLNDFGELVTTEEKNGIKFETFIFDALKRSERSVAMEVVRKDEFAPIKNMEGDDSPAIARQAMINMFGRWLSEAGVNIPFDAHHNVKGIIEINPLYALDSEELKRKIKKGIVFNGRLELGR